MFYSEQLNELYERVILSIDDNVAKKGVESSFNNNVVVKLDEEEFSLGGDGYVVEIGLTELYNKHGYAFNFSNLSYEDLCSMADYLENL
jgi:hypothetical protein